MTEIDEAIAHAEEVAEENQRVVDTGIVFNDVTIDMLYCDDTEVIDEHLANYQKVADNYRQIADWLKDYKRLKEQESFHEVKKKGKDGRVDMTDSSTDSSTDLSTDSSTADDCISREDALLCLTGEIKETDTAESLISRFVKRIRKLPSVNPQEPKVGWIPVSERLPEPYQNILVTAEDFHFANEPVIYSVYKKSFSGDVDFIAWMPLPELYEPQESEEV